jgi:hypothetical protein
VLQLELQQLQELLLAHALAAVASHEIVHTLPQNQRLF